MFRFIMILVLVLVPLFVSAQESEGEESLTPEEQSRQFCEARFSGTGSADVLKRLFCIQHQNMRILEARMKKGESGLKNQVEELRKQLETTKADLAKQALSAQASPNPNPPSGPSSEPAPTPQPQGPSLPAFVGGVPFGVMDVPGQLAATTRDVEGIDRLWVQSILDGVKYFRRGATQVRVVVRKNGITVPVAQPDTIMFDEFYADINNDGKPDARAYKGLDPSRIDDVYISNVGPRDTIELVYLVPTGRLVTIAGLPPQVLWGRPVRTKLDRLSDIGRWKMSATTAIALR